MCHLITSSRTCGQMGASSCNCLRTLIKSSSVLLSSPRNVLRATPMQDPVACRWQMSILRTHSLHSCSSTPVHGTMPELNFVSAQLSRVLARMAAFDTIMAAARSLAPCMGSGATAAAGYCSCSSCCSWCHPCCGGSPSMTSI